MEIISRAEAKERGLTRYFSGEPCKFGHVSMRSVIDTKCVECTLTRQNEKRAKLRAEKFPDGRDPWKKCEPGRKVCIKCREAKPESEFSPDKRAIDGRQAQCHPCQNRANKDRRAADPESAKAKAKAYYNANKEVFLAKAKLFRERHRDQLLASKKAYYDRVKLDASWQQRAHDARKSKKALKSQYDRVYRARNPELSNRRAKDWAKRNPEKRAAISKNYDHRRRAKEKRGVSTADLLAWEMSAKKVCYWCGVKCADNYHIDHYVPLSKDGEHELSNLVIACPPCNLRKNAKDPYAFAASVGRLF